MLNYDYGTLQRYLAETPVPAEKYRPKHAGDFGGPETVQVHLKRAGKSFRELVDTPGTAFGVYLGQHGHWYVVGIKDLMTGALVGFEEFPTLARLKAAWEAD
jgi:hypothetical protein